MRKHLLEAHYFSDGQFTIDLDEIKKDNEKKNPAKRNKSSVDYSLKLENDMMSDLHGEYNRFLKMLKLIDFKDTDMKEFYVK